MFFSDNELSTLDIDWFVKIGRYPFHIASAGGNVPVFVKESVEDSDRLLKSVRRKSNDKYGRKEINVNANLAAILRLNENIEDYKKVVSALGKDVYVEDMNEDEIIKIYLRKYYVPPFEYYAKKGFISLDRNINGPNPDTYHLVAMPIDMGERIEDFDSLTQIDCNDDDEVSLLNELWSDNFDILSFIEKLQKS